ncbi:hypothetical protein AVEN_147594-1 [Araneus ventricosus]|uniref:Uncharacterized protein n=1 Tax=Araneus ventricosus TaxID=182803 RepID=A0A4Y2H4I4_ARAVE|nr:hypothetical protein AVEN_147594-1 [Araneus ventricosus]
MNQLTTNFRFCVNKSAVFQLDFHKHKEIDLQYPDFVADGYVHGILKKIQGVFAFLLKLDQWNREKSKSRKRSFKEREIHFHSQNPQGLRTTLRILRPSYSPNPLGEPLHASGVIGT